MNKEKAATVVIRNFSARNRNFTIVKDAQGFYQAIEDKYIDKDGRVTKTLYGHQTFASRELNMTLQNLQNGIEFDYLVEQGHSKGEAFGIVHNLLGKIDLATLEGLFA